MFSQARRNLFFLTINSPVCALFIIISIVLLYGNSQEIFAINSPHDDYYFLLRSASFGLGGDYHAPLKEYLYPLFIKISRASGISLRNFEVMCYGSALFLLWQQTVKLSRSYLIGWLAILPMSVFVYQCQIFNQATYDALQLILTPLSVASALLIFTRRGDTGSLVIAGCIAGLQTLTRPEGFLFVIPVVVSVVMVYIVVAIKKNRRLDISLFSRKIAIIFFIPFAFQQAISAVNYTYFGFWAPTIMKSSGMTRSLSALMSIQPSNSDASSYAPVPISSMEQAYRVSPAFHKAKAFFDQHLNGKGWSSFSSPGYGTDDGSIDGGHFQWALLDAGAFVAGPKPDAIVAYLNTVAEQVQSAFEDRKLTKRRVLSTALGPNFSFFNRSFWVSLRQVWIVILNQYRPILPTITSIQADSHVEADFDRLALRRTALLESHNTLVSGWVMDSTLGVPHQILLDQDAQNSGVNLKVIERPDVVRAMLGMGSTKNVKSLCGIELNIPKSAGLGNIIIDYGQKTVLLPLDKIKSMISGSTNIENNVAVHVDNSATASANLSGNMLFVVVRWVALNVYYLMKILFILIALWLIIVIYFKGRIISAPDEKMALLFIGSITFSIIVPRLILLAGIDSAMYPGVAIRYLAAAAFPLWYFATFIAAYLFHKSLLSLKWKFKK